MFFRLTLQLNFLFTRDFSKLKPSLSVQEILEKFEFFPVKCRVQRALEIYQIEQEKKQAESEKILRFKTKVIVI